MRENNIFDVIEKACEQIFIPIIISGGIRSLKDIELALKSGADKVAINTQAVKNPSFINEAAKSFGSQCIVGAIDCKKNNNNWEVLTEGGREYTGLNAFDWALKLQDFGIGELILTSVDMEGTKKGFDLEITNKISSSLKVPVIASGGAGTTQDIVNLAKNSEVTGIATASILHYNIENVTNIKKALTESNINTRL